MNCENLLIKATRCTDKEERARLLGDVFAANLGITVTLMRELCKNTEHYEDFMQSAYIALVKTCNSYKEGSEHSPLSHYRMWLRHENYQMWLKNGGRAGIQEVELNTEIRNEDRYNKTNNATEIVEKAFMDSLLWKRVDAILTSEDSDILKRRFCRNQTLKTIGGEYSISAERVRQRIIRSCNALYRDRDVCDVALFYGYR